MGQSRQRRVQLLPFLGKRMQMVEAVLFGKALFNVPTAHCADIEWASEWVICQFMMPCIFPQFYLLLQQVE